MKPGLPKHSGFQSAAIAWLDRRLPFVDAIDTELYRRVPNYATAFHRYLGALAVILVCIEFGTGVLLAVYYVPDATGNPAQAFRQCQSHSGDCAAGLAGAGNALLGRERPVDSGRAAYDRRLLDRWLPRAA